VFAAFESSQLFYSIKMIAARRLAQKGKTKHE
jgi:hypothetical protein